jgi:hypothetical protein
VDVGAAVTKVSINERQPTSCVVSLATGSPVKVDFKEGRSESVQFPLTGEPALIQVHLPLTA